MNDIKRVTVTKRYENLKAAHRQWRHPGHCKFVHGENWAFEIMFIADEPDECGFVIDFGKLRPLKALLDKWFDHTLLLDHDDPEIQKFKALEEQGIVDLRIVDSCSAEGLASFVYVLAETFLATKRNGFYKRNVRVLKVVCYEDNKNSAVFFSQECK